MVNPALRGFFKKQGVSLIPLEAGAEMLLRELNDDPDADVEVLFVGGEGVMPRVDSVDEIATIAIESTEQNANSPRASA